MKKKVNVNITVLEATRINIGKSKSSVVVAKSENKEMRGQPIRVPTSKSKNLNTNLLVNNWPIEDKVFIN